MSTHIAAAQARADQATADRERAERMLARTMRKLDRTYDPGLFPVAEAIKFRRWETLLEMPNPPAAFAKAHAAFRRAQRLEARARTATHRARFDIRPATGAAGGLVALTAGQVLEGLRERRAA